MSVPGPTGGSLPWAADPDLARAGRHLDEAARWLRSRGTGRYTIGSAGHEGNAAVAAALRPTDPALLHYRSGAFYLLRAARAGGSRPGAQSPLDRGVAGEPREDDI